MPMLRVRLTGTETDANAVISNIHGIDGIERIEQIDDLMPHMDDDDSSSAGLVDDIGSSNVYSVEIETPDHRTGEQVREVINRSAEAMGMAVEFVDEF